MDEGIFRVSSMQSSFLISQANRTLHCFESSLEKESPQSFLLIYAHTILALLSPLGLWKRQGTVDKAQRPRSWSQLCTFQLWYLQNVTPGPPWAPLGPWLLLTYKMIELNSEGPLPLKDPLIS